MGRPKKTTNVNITSNDNFTLKESVDHHRVWEILLSDFDIPHECYPYLIKQLSDEVNVCYESKPECPEGRYYAMGHSLQYLCKEIRGFICQDNYIDIDIKNCFPSILNQLAIRYKFQNTHLNNYCVNRNKILKANPHYKDEIRGVICGMEKSKLPQDFHEELVGLCENIMLKLGLDGEEDTIKTVMWKILQKEERMITNKIKKILEDNRVKISAYCSDGFIVHKSGEKLLDKINKEISPYEVVIKPWDIPKVNSKYKRNTFNWESNINFSEIQKLQNSTFVSEGQVHKKILPLCLETLRLMGSTKNGWLVKIANNEYAVIQPFNITFTVAGNEVQISAYLQQYVGFLSFSHMTPSNTPKPYQFSTFRGLAFKILDKPQNELEEIIKPFTNHVKEVLCNGDMGCYEHFIRMLAHYVQYPFKPTQVGYVFCGKGGIGKSTIMRLLIRIFGKWNVLQVKGVDILTKKFNVELEGKMLVCCEELRSATESDWRADVDAIKNIIDAETLQIERKGIDCHTSENVINVIAFSNNQYALPMSDGGMERRFVVTDTDPKYANDKKYFDDLYGLFDNERFINAIGTYLSRLEVGNVRVPLPMTELKQKSIFKWRPHIEKTLLIAYVLNKTRLTTSEIKDLARDYGLKIDKNGGRLGDDIKRLVGARNDSDRRYTIAPNKQFTMEIHLLDETRKFIDDYHDEHEMGCLID